MRVIFLCTCILGLSIGSTCQVISFEGISEVKPLKRGSTYQLIWSGGNESDLISLELAKGNSSFGRWDQAINKGSASIKLPLSIKVGNGYYFKIINKSTNSITTTDPFKIKRKRSLGGKLAIASLVPLTIMTALVIRSSAPPSDIQTLNTYN